jgi:hypothetical protein
MVRLANLAKMLLMIESKLAPAAIDPFRAKVERLLRVKPQQLHEHVVELAAGTALATFVDELELDVPAATPARSAANLDYGFEFGEEYVLVEVTTLYLKELRDWHACIARIRHRLGNALLGADLIREVHLSAGLGISNSSLLDTDIADIIAEVRANDVGEFTTDHGEVELHVSWGTVPQFARMEDITDGFPGAFAFVGNGTIETALGTTASLSWPGDTEARVHRSLRNTLKGKRKQCQRDDPYVLWLEVPNESLPIEQVDDLIERRILQNDAFAWISAVMLTETLFSQHNGFVATTKFNVNSKARRPLPAGLAAAFGTIGSIPF